MPVRYAFSLTVSAVSVKKIFELENLFFENERE